MNISFSALQRAENSSILTAPVVARLVRSFSALQRAENSSITAAQRRTAAASAVSVLFSEPKIPQCEELGWFEDVNPDVSVLFSEPKIPQFAAKRRPVAARDRFSALQRAENSSIDLRPRRPLLRAEFQCSSASRKFLNPITHP